jgi:hypothetical protein
LTFEPSAWPRSAAAGDQPESSNETPDGFGLGAGFGAGFGAGLGFGAGAGAGGGVTVWTRIGAE